MQVENLFCDYHSACSDLPPAPPRNPSAHTHTHTHKHRHTCWYLVFFYLLSLGIDKADTIRLKATKVQATYFVHLPCFIPLCLPLYYNTKQTDVQRISKQINKKKRSFFFQVIQPIVDSVFLLKLRPHLHKLSFLLPRRRPNPHHPSLSFTSLQEQNEKTHLK